MANNKKNIKTNDKKNEEEVMPLKELLIIIGVISIVFIVIYLLTLGANKLGWFDPRYNKKEVGNAIISYEKIMYGTALDREENDYYVIFTDSKNEHYYMDSIIIEYRETDASKERPLYVVDLSEGLNRNIVSDTTNLNVTNAKDLKVSDDAMIRVVNHSVKETYSGSDNIKNGLK